MSIVRATRILLFYLLLGTSSLLWCSLSFFIAPFLPFRQRYRFINVYWCRFAVLLARVILGIRYKVTGEANILATHYQADLAGVWFVGDSSGDLDAALAVGAQPVLVTTGKGCKTLAKGVPQGTLIFDDLAAVAGALIP